MSKPAASAAHERDHVDNLKDQLAAHFQRDLRNAAAMKKYEQADQSRRETIQHWERGTALLNDALARSKAEVVVLERKNAALQNKLAAIQRVFDG